MEYPRQSSHQLTFILEVAVMRAVLARVLPQAFVGLMYVDYVPLIMRGCIAKKVSCRQPIGRGGSVTSVILCPSRWSLRYSRI